MAALDSDDEPEEAELLPKSKKRKSHGNGNDLYDATAKNQALKKAAKQAKYKAKPLSAPLEDEREDGPRRLTKAVEKNRGLTPHRSKDNKNPRLKVDV